jgi:hypothetical protein
MLKKLFLSLVVILSITVLAGCQSNEKEDLFYFVHDAAAIGQWIPMETPAPGGGEGSVTVSGNVAIVKAAADGWGGVQSAPFTIDLSKDPMLFVQVAESADGYKWGAKFVPTVPAVDGHEWGVYLIEDNDFKWNNYAVSDIVAKLGQDFIDLYGTEVEGVIWIMAAGAEATVEVTEIKLMNQK